MKKYVSMLICFTMVFTLLGTVPISAATPSVSDVYIEATDGSLAVGSTLTLKYTPGADSGTLEDSIVTWYGTDYVGNKTELASGSSKTYTIKSTDVGKQITATFTPISDGVTGTPVESAEPASTNTYSRIMAGNLMMGTTTADNVKITYGSTSLNNGWAWDATRITKILNGLSGYFAVYANSSMAANTPTNLSFKAKVNNGIATYVDSFFLETAPLNYSRGLTLTGYLNGVSVGVLYDTSIQATTYKYSLDKPVYVDEVQLTLHFSQGKETIRMNRFELYRDDAVIVSKAAQALDFGTIKNENTESGNVKTDLSLPSTMYDVAVSWESSNQSVVANDGTVTQPDATQTVTLTATCTSGEVVEQKQIVVTVPGKNAENSMINPTAASFDLNPDAEGHADIPVTYTGNGNAFEGLSVSGTDLMVGTDYTVSENVVTIKKEYLAKLAEGTHTISFVTVGQYPTLTVTVTDSRPSISNVVLLAPNGMCVDDEITVSYDIAAGSGMTTENDVSTVEWRRNGVAIEGQNGKSYTITSADIDKQITAVVTPKFAYSSSVTYTGLPVESLKPNEDRARIMGGNLIANATNVKATFVQTKNTAFQGNWISSTLTDIMNGKNRAAQIIGTGKDDSGNKTTLSISANLKNPGSYIDTMRLQLYAGIVCTGIKLEGIREGKSVVLYNEEWELRTIDNTVRDYQLSPQPVDSIKLTLTFDHCRYGNGLARLELYNTQHDTRLELGTDDSAITIDNSYNVVRTAQPMTVGELKTKLFCSGTINGIYTDGSDTPAEDTASMAEGMKIKVTSLGETTTKEYTFTQKEYVVLDLAFKDNISSESTPVPGVQAVVYMFEEENNKTFTLYAAVYNDTTATELSDVVVKSKDGNNSDDNYKIKKGVNTITLRRDSLPISSDSKAVMIMLWDENIQPYCKPVVEFLK